MTADQADAAMFADLRRVEDRHGSHIEPALDQTWSEHVKLLWCAAVTRVDDGISITVRPNPRDGLFDVSAPGAGVIGPLTYEYAWWQITAMGEGAVAARAASRYLLVQNGCNECTELSAVVRAYADREEAQAESARLFREDTHGTLRTYPVLDLHTGGQQLPWAELEELDRRRAATDEQ